MYRTLYQASGVFDGIALIQNREVVANYLNGTLDEGRIECRPMKNIRLIKKTKRFIVISADTVIKGKSKQKRMKIYSVYHDMESLLRICGKEL